MAWRSDSQYVYVPCPRCRTVYRLRRRASVVCSCGKRVSVPPPVDPTPVEIELAKERIQARWSADDRRKRATADVLPTRWEPQMAAESDLLEV